MKTGIFQSDNVAETYAFGRKLGRLLRANDILALKGDLGSGKTTLTHGIAEGLGIKTPVSSPTFTLLFEHPAGERNLPLFHFDAYRLNDEYEWYDAGFMEYLDAGGVTIIEWAERIRKVLPDRTIWLELEKDEANPEIRYFRLHIPSESTFEPDALREKDK